MLSLLLVGLLHAADPVPASGTASGTNPAVGTAPAPATPPAPPVTEEPVEPESASTPPPVEARVAGEEIDVTQGEEVLRKRAELYESLVQEGYIRRLRRNERTVFLSEQPWKPRVVVHDDGWVYFKRQPPRIHAPGRSFSDQGSPAAYLLCVLAPTSCLSVGGWLVSPRKMGAVTAEVTDATRDKVRAMNDAVARRELGYRLNEAIPNDLDAIWSRVELPPEDRHALLFEYWDTRTDTPEGEAAKGAIEAFLRGVVQQSDTPIGPDALAALNARRSSLRALDLTAPSLGEP